MKKQLNTLIEKNYFNPPNSVKQQLYKLFFWGKVKSILVKRTLKFLNKEELNNLEKCIIYFQIKIQKIF